MTPEEKTGLISIYRDTDGICKVYRNDKLILLTGEKLNIVNNLSVDDRKELKQIIEQFQKELGR